MNYTTLQSDIASYLDRTDLTSRIQEFISLAEHRLMHDLKFRGVEKAGTVSLTSGSTTVTPPPRFRSIIVLERADGTPIKYRPISFIEQYLSSLTTATGAPIYYSLFDDTIYVAPTADANYTLPIKYYEEIEPLATATTNYFTDETPQLLLYATLLEAAPFLHNDERIPVWQDRYDRFMQSVAQDQSAYQTDQAVR